MILNILVFFKEKILDSLLSGQGREVLGAVRGSRRLHRKTLGRLRGTQTHLQGMRVRTGRFQVAKCSRVRQRGLGLVGTASGALRRLRGCGGRAVRFRRRETVGRIQRQIFRRTLRKTLKALGDYLGGRLRLHAVDAGVNVFKAIGRVAS